MMHRSCDSLIEMLGTSTMRDALLTLYSALPHFIGTGATSRYTRTIPLNRGKKGKLTPTK